MDILRPTQCHARNAMRRATRSQAPNHASPSDWNRHRSRARASPGGVATRQGARSAAGEGTGTKRRSCVRQRRAQDHGPQHLFRGRVAHTTASGANRRSECHGMGSWQPITGKANSPQSPARRRCVRTKRRWSPLRSTGSRCPLRLRRRLRPARRSVAKRSSGTRAAGSSRGCRPTPPRRRSGPCRRTRP